MKMTLKKTISIFLNGFLKISMAQNILSLYPFANDLVISLLYNLAYGSSLIHYPSLMRSENAALVSINWKISIRNTTKVMTKEQKEVMKIFHVKILEWYIFQFRSTNRIFYFSMIYYLRLFRQNFLFLNTVASCFLFLMIYHPRISTSTKVTTYTGKENDHHI
jgi:hypothetical protein